MSMLIQMNIKESLSFLKNWKKQITKLIFIKGIVFSKGENWIDTWERIIVERGKGTQGEKPRSRMENSTDLFC
jgi:hypothetical protein